MAIELSDAEVFGASPPNPAGRELSDAEVFGTAPTAAKELSDAEVFGATEGQPSTFDKLSNLFVPTIPGVFSHAIKTVALDDKWQDVARSLPAQFVEGVRLSTGGVLRGLSEGDPNAALPVNLRKPRRLVIPPEGSIQANMDIAAIEEEKNRISQYEENARKNPAGSLIYGMRDTGREMTDKAREALKKATPKDMTFWQDATVTAARSLGIALPGILASVATRSPAPALGAMGLAEFGSSFDENIRSGMDPDKARQAAIMSAGVEAYTEVIPLNKLLSLLPKQGMSIFKKMVKMYIPEIAQENLATLGQDAIQFAAKNPGATFKDWYEGYIKNIPEQAARTTASTLISSTIQTGGAQAAHSLLRSGKSELTDAEVFGQAPAAPETTTAEQPQTPPTTEMSDADIGIVSRETPTDLTQKYPFVGSLPAREAIPETSLDTKGKPFVEKPLYSRQKTADDTIDLPTGKDSTNLIGDDLLKLFDSAEQVTLETPRKTETEVDADEARFLSDAPAGTRYGRRTRLLAERIRPASEAATADLQGSPTTDRRLDGKLGPFSGYQTTGEIDENNGELRVHVYGNEQLDAGLTQEPALTFTVTPEGELTIAGPHPNFDTFTGFQERGWAGLAKDSVGKTLKNWSAIRNPSDPEGGIPIRQMIPLLADVHARVRAWRMDDYVGLYWARSTGATGGLESITGKNGTAVYFSKGDKAETTKLPWEPTRKSVENTIAPVLSRWKNGPKVTVVQSTSGIPDNAVPHDVEGAYIGNGKIYLVADNLRSEQRALQVLAHEAVGHAAVEELFGDDLKFILEGVKYLEKTDKRVREIAQHVDETQPGLDEKTRTKEIIAVMAERGVHNNLMRRVMAAIRRFLRSIGIDMEFSYDDLAGMLRSAERYLESGGERTDIGDLQPLFSLKKNDIRNALASRGVKGDALENAVDLANDLKEKGGVITPEGTAILYHRTTKESAEKIVREQAMHGKEDGLFFGTSPTGQIEGYGEAVVQIEVPLEKISLNDVFANEAHVRMKTGTIGGKIPVRAKTAVQGQPLFQESKDIKRGSISVSPSGKEGELFQSDVKKQTGTPEFKKWFGDSKVVDEDGNPLLMYHGTAREFTEFDPSLSGSTYGTEQSGIFFTDDRENALAVARDAAESLKGAPRIMEVYLKINTPLTIKVSEEYATNYWDKHWREIMDGFDHDQYDGIIIKSAAHNYILGAKEYPTNAEMLAIVFEQTKIKSAIGNRGTFDPNDPNILFSRQQPDKGVSNFPNPAKYYARHAQRVIDWLYPKIGKYLGPLKDLPNQKAFQERYYLLLGGIARIEDISRRIYDTFRNASEADQRSVFNFLTNRTVPASSILNPEIRQHAVATKRLINRVGDGLVARGLLDPSTRGKYRDQYLPRIYLKHMLGESAFRNMGTGLKPGDMGYLKGRKDLSADVRALLGEITDPAYLASRGVSIPMRDMAILDFFKGIASTPRNQWVWGHHLVDGWNGPVSVFWLEAEAKRLRNQANFMQGKARQDALNLAQQYESWSAPVIAEQSDVPGNFRQIPNTGRYGALRGLWVRKEIHNLLIGSRMISDDASVAEKILGYGGWGTKVTQFWKTMKVPFNPPSQVRNLVSNFVLLHVSGVPLHRIPQRFVQAIQEIRTNGKHWRIAKKYGIKATTFTNQELLKLETELLESMRQQKPSTVADLKFWSSRIMDVVGGAYQGLESIGKTMKIIDAMEREGMSEADAVLAAQEALFDYSMVPKSIRYLRQAPIGAPFITFYYKALPMLLKNFITAPHRFLPYVLIPYLLAAMIADDYDVDVEDLEKLKKALPEWLQKRGHTMILPWKDSNGRWQVFDYGYFMPWGYFSELFNEIKQTVGSGQVGETGRIVGATGLLGGPIPDLIAAIKTNKDPFTKRDIVNKNDPPARQLSDLMTYLWRMGAPTWLTDIGYAGHTYRWLTGKVNPRLGPEYGEQLLTGPQTQARAVGVNIYPIDPKKSRMQNIRNMVSDMGNVMQRMTTKMMDPNLSPEQRRGVREEYMKEIKMRRDNIRKYQKESEVHPNLLREPK